MADLDEEIARHHRAAFGWALACCRWDPAAAEDVLHTAYLKVIDGRARLAEGTEFRPFIFGVIRRTAYEERRRQAIRAVLPLTALGVEPATASSARDVLTEFVHDETSRRLLGALDKLSPRQRDVLLLVFYRDMTIAAAAQVLGVSLGTARIHYERGKEQLRRLLGDE